MSWQTFRGNLLRTGCGGGIRPPLVQLWTAEKKAVSEEEGLPGSTEILEDGEMVCGAEATPGREDGDATMELAITFFDALSGDRLLRMHAGTGFGESWFLGDGFFRLYDDQTMELLSVRARDGETSQATYCAEICDSVFLGDSAVVVRKNPLAIEAKTWMGILGQRYRSEQRSPGEILTDGTEFDQFAVDLVDLADGTPTWSFGLMGIVSRFASDGRGLYFSTSHGLGYGIDLGSGGVIFEAKIGSRSTFPPVLAGGLALFYGQGETGTSVTACDAETGEPVWQRTLAGRASANASAGGGLVVAACNDGMLHALELEGGQEAWSVQAQAAAPALAIAGEHVVSAEGEEVAIYEMDSGEEAQRVRLPGRVRAVTAGDGRIFAATDTVLAAFGEEG